MSLHSVMAPIPALDRHQHGPREEADGERERARERTDVAARQLLADRAVHLVPELVLDDGELLGRERVRIHVRVHGGEQVDGDKGRQGAQERRLRAGEGASEVRTRARGEGGGRGEKGTHEDVVADAVGDLGERVGRAGRDEDDVGPPSQLREEEA